MAFHTFDIHEVFSNFDGTIQFIELKQPTDDAENGEGFFATHKLVTSDGNEFIFPSNLQPDPNATAGKSILIATAGFETATGLEADYIIPSGFLPFSGSVTLQGADQSSTWTNMPTDGHTSINFNINSNDEQTRVDATPTNFAGQTDTVDVPGNDRPEVDTPLVDKTTGVGQAFSYTFLAGTFSDPDDDELSYTATLSTGGALPGWLDFDDETRTFTGTPLSGNVGTLNVKVTASDGFGTASDIFVLKVISGQVIKGTSAPESLNGTEGSDVITGVGGADTLIGGNGGDTINGGAGGDLIIGGGGADRLTGDIGADRFRFSEAASSDVLVDFQGGIDKIQLENGVYKKFTTTGALSSTRIEQSTNVSATSGDPNDFLKYDTDSGRLYYDSNGNGTGGLKLIATITSSGTAFDPTADVLII